MDGIPKTREVRVTLVGEDGSEIIYVIGGDPLKLICDMILPVSIPSRASFRIEGDIVECKATFEGWACGSRPQIQYVDVARLDLDCSPLKPR